MREGARRPRSAVCGGRSLRGSGRGRPLRRASGYAGAVFLARRPRSAALRPFVEQLWLFQGEGLGHARERILPSARAQLLVNLAEDRLGATGWDGAWSTGGAALQGAHDRPFELETRMQRAVVGAVFRPGGQLPFFPPADATRNQHVPLDALWARARLRERLLEAPTPAGRLDVLERVLLERARHLSAEPALAAAAAQLEAGLPVGAVRDALGASHRRFVAWARRGLGTSPKRYQRVRRLQRLLGRMTRGSAAGWAALAAEAGYADQAHLIREFRALTGMTPTAYAARPPGDVNHALLE